MEVTAFCERATAIVHEGYQGLVKIKQLQYFVKRLRLKIMSND